MKTKNIFVFLLSAGLALTCTNCNMLEPGQDNTYSEDRIVADASFAEGLLLRAYAALPNGYDDFTEVATDDAVTNDKGSMYAKMVSGGWSALYNPVSNWSQSYEVIAYINQFLKIADKVEWSWQDSTRNEKWYKRLTGEAFALRAYYYFLVLQNHGGLSSKGEMLGIPYLKKMPVTGDKSTWNLPRPSYMETARAILADLAAAKELLPQEYMKLPNDPAADRLFGIKFRNRIDKRICTALMARIAMFVASPAYNGGSYNEEMCQVAAANAAELIQNVGGINALTAAKGVLADKLFYDNNNDSKNVEILWRQNYVTNSTIEQMNFPPTLFGNGRINPTQNFVDAFPMANGYPINMNESYFNELDPYAGRDPRLGESVIYNGSTFKNVVINTSVSGSNDGLNVLTNSTVTGYYLKKLMREDVSINPSSTRQHFRPLIRYTEIFLIYAEAANEAYGPDNANTAGVTARQVIRAIRQRSKVGGTTATSDTYLNSLASKEQLRELIRNERRIEMSFEGFRFWDMRRWELNLSEPAKGIRIDESGMTKINVEDRVFASYMKYGPIPNAQIIKTDSLIQNQGW